MPLKSCFAPLCPTSSSTIPVCHSVSHSVCFVTFKRSDTWVLGRKMFLAVHTTRCRARAALPGRGRRRPADVDALPVLCGAASEASCWGSGSCTGARCGSARATHYCCQTAAPHVLHTTAVNLYSKQTRALFTFTQNSKTFQDSRHIESLDACM